MRESRKPPSFWKERSPESSDILRAFIICYACSGHVQALSSSLSISCHARFCPPRFLSHVMQGSVLLAVILRSCKVLSSTLSLASLLITAITLYCRLLYLTAMFVNQRWAYSSLMTTIQKSWNLSLYSNNNQQRYNNIWTHYTSVILSISLHSRRVVLLWFSWLKWFLNNEKSERIFIAYSPGLFYLRLAMR